MALRCQNDYAVCSFKYNPEKGEPESDIMPGTSLEEIPDDWICPRCRVENIEQEIEGGNHG